MIELNQVTKRYGTKVAVENLSLHIAEGELFAFLGPNGAGKTTTIKMICGLLFPTSGSIRVGGFDVVAQGDQARQLLSYVPDQPFLYEKLSGANSSSLLPTSMACRKPTPSEESLKSSSYSTCRNS